MSAPQPASVEDRRYAESKRARNLVTLARSRMSSLPLRLVSAAIMSMVASSLTGNVMAFVWIASFVLVNVVDWFVFKRLLARCEAGDPPADERWTACWIAFQSIQGVSLSVLLWFSPYSSGETLAAILLCGASAASAGTMRSSRLIALGSIGPVVIALIGMPVVEYVLAGADDPILLLPMAGGLLVLSFGGSLWRSLMESDAAQLRAEVAAMRERQSAAAAAAAKSDTIRRMNDELRTPMQALVGAAEHLRRAAATPESRAHIATLVQAGEVLKLVLDDLSDLDRLENGSLAIEPAPADPREIARGVAAAFRAAAQDKHLELFLDLGEAPALVKLDARRVRQVLFNLVANAVRYTTHGGVRVSLAVRSAETAGIVKLHFAVTDTGAGMTRAQLARIFGRDRLCAEGEGPGLGLAISLRLARLMGGAIHAKSEPGQGSAFSLQLEAPVVAARMGQTAA